MLLLPTFRLPTLIHSRSGNAKVALRNFKPESDLDHPEDPQRLEVATGDLLKVRSAIGYFVDKVWVREGIRPCIIACSHHLGRWRLDEQAGGSRWATVVVDLKEVGPGKWKMRQIRRIGPLVVSGQHCWHQKVRLETAQADDRYGDIYVDTEAAHEIYRQWLKLARLAPGPGNLRRPLWLVRVYRPAPEAFYLTDRGR
jgi:anaerobic selenocysteine-containing dehydrogenase